MKTLTYALIATMLAGIAIPVLGDVYPKSDPENKSGWVLNPNVSDEFNGKKVDQLKWYVQGKNQEFYIWKGRAPSQFAPHNVVQENGMLKIRTQWEPDYQFVGGVPKKQGEGKYENITTGALISHKPFLYGYMEIRAKIPDAPMTGGFWGTGYQQELDVFELTGRVDIGSKNPETTFITSIHDWRPGHPKKNKVWKHPHKTPDRVADNFYTYGVEWLPDGLKMYFEGELVHHAKQEDLADAWVLNNPMEVWLDSEVFDWHGVPTKADLPADFEVDYVRIWQKEDNSLIEPAFYGFEGPYVGEATNKPASRHSYQKFWWLNTPNNKFLNITEPKEYLFSTGRKSLRFHVEGLAKSKRVVANSPEGSILLSEGHYELSYDVWLSKDANIQSANIVLTQPWQQIKPVPLNELPREKWVTLTQTFKRDSMSGVKDKMQVSINLTNNNPPMGTILLDNIKIEKEER